jgi:predicted nucleic acid-binding protein
MTICNEQVLFFFFIGKPLAWLHGSMGDVLKKPHSYLFSFGIKIAHFLACFLRKEKRLKIYLDVCCLNRPFDDQTQDRVRLETEAILLIINKAIFGKLSLVNSEAIEVEIDNIPDTNRREKISLLGSKTTKEYIAYTQEIIAYAKSLAQLGLKKMDALHIACAKTAKVDAFLTTDDRLIKVAKRNISAIQINIENPLNWLAKQEEEYENT